MYACTGSAFPLAWNGSSSTVSNLVRDRSNTSSVVSSCPGSAFAIRRAARFTASPLTEYVRR